METSKPQTDPSDLPGNLYEHHVGDLTVTAFGQPETGPGSPPGEINVRRIEFRYSAPAHGNPPTLTSFALALPHRMIDWVENLRLNRQGHQYVGAQDVEPFLIDDDFDMTAEMDGDPSMAGGVLSVVFHFAQGGPLGQPA